MHARNGTGTHLAVDTAATHSAVETASNHIMLTWPWQAAQLVLPARRRAAFYQPRALGAAVRSECNPEVWLGSRGALARSFRRRRLRLGRRGALASVLFRNTRTEGNADEMVK